MLADGGLAAMRKWRGEETFYAPSIWPGRRYSANGTSANEPEPRWRVVSEAVYAASRRRRKTLRLRDNAG
ncbi:hypothetical protein KCP73_01540 [Salmonella enterica subsp. enterica]|nr:hypothetical protein KCP73_01540 [Salmonella enterica subsp. enterica]